jgi:hypothetical protein
MQKMRSLPAIFLALYCAGVLVLAAQPLITFMQPGFQGVLYKGGDESQYIMRIAQAMSHPWTDVSNSIITGPGAPRGLQMTFLEMMSGSLFSVSPFSAPVVAIALSVLFAPLVMPLFVLLACALGIPRRHALIGSVIFFFLLIGPLKRVVHQSWSLPFVLLTLLVMVRWFHEPGTRRSLALGILLGLAPGIYFWSWTYLWAVWGLTVLFAFPKRSLPMRPVIMTAITSLLFAAPFLTLMYLNAHHPAVSDASFRSSLVHARELESIPRSLVLSILAACSLFVLWRMRHERDVTLPTAMITALWIVLHQQFVHGLVLSYWTHYYPYVVFTSILLILFILNNRTRRLADVVVILAASVLLAGAFFDYKGRLAVFTPLPHWEQYQHLHDPIAILRGMSHRTVLSDLDSSLVIGTYTDHDILFGEFLRHTLITTRELADRYCMTEVVSGKKPDTLWLANNVYEMSAAGRALAHERFLQDIDTTIEACNWVAANVRQALQRYHVGTLLWDERNHPEWKIDVQLFQKTQSGDGWSLWVIK